MRAVGIVDVQFADHPRTSAPAGHLETPCGDGLDGVVESVAQHRREDVLALAEPVGDIMHGIEVTLVVMGVARVEEVPRDGFAVQGRLRIGRGAHIEPGALDAGPHIECPPQHRRGNEILVVGVGNPAGLPFGGVHQGRFELRDGRDDPPSVGVPRLDLPVVRGPRGEQPAVGHHGKGTAAGDLPGVPDIGNGQLFGSRGYAQPEAGLRESVGIFISPCKAGRLGVDRDRRGEVFAAHVGDRGTLSAGARQQRQAAQHEPADGVSKIHNIHRVRKFIGVLQIFRLQAHRRPH